MAISVLTCDDHVDQIIRVATENGSPQDVQFRDPATFLGAGIAASGVDTNENAIAGELEISWLSTDGPITPEASAKYLVWCTFGYNCDSTNNVFTLAVQPLDADEITVATAQLPISLPTRQVTLFGLIQVANEPFLWRLTCTSDSGSMTIDVGQMRLMWLELAGPYVAPPPPPP